MRICSLLPGATEIVCALGLGEQLVAVTHECDYPPAVRHLPVVTRSLLEGTGGSRDIDQHVTAAAHDGSSLYGLDQELLARLDPDLVLTQELCQVCALSYAQVTSAVGQLSGPRTVLSLSPRRLEDVLEAIVAVGNATGVTELAQALVDRLRQRTAAVAAQARRATITPRVFAMEWLEPPYTAGHWVPEMIRLAGGDPVGARDGAFSEPIAWDAVIEMDPHVVIFMPCSFDLPRAVEELARVPFPSTWTEIAAVREGRVAVVDSSAYFSRSGPRLIDGLEILGEILHPELFPRRAAADAWCLVDGLRLGGQEGGR